MTDVNTKAHAIRFYTFTACWPEMSIYVFKLPKWKAGKVITSRSHSIPGVKPEWLHRRNDHAFPWGRFLPWVIVGRLLCNEWTNFLFGIVLTPDTTTTFMEIFYTTLSAWAPLGKRSLFPYPHHRHQTACEPCSCIHGCSTVLLALLVCFAVWCAIHRLLLFLRVIYPLPVICIGNMFLCLGILLRMVQPQGETEGNIILWGTLTSPSHCSLD